MANAWLECVCDNPGVCHPIVLSLCKNFHLIKLTFGGNVFEKSCLFDVTLFQINSYDVLFFLRSILLRIRNIELRFNDNFTKTCNMSSIVC